MFYDVEKHVERILFSLQTHPALSLSPVLSSFNGSSGLCAWWSHRGMIYQAVTGSSCSAVERQSAVKHTPLINTSQGDLQFRLYLT